MASIFDVLSGGGGDIIGQAINGMFGGGQGGGGLGNMFGGGSGGGGLGNMFGGGSGGGGLSDMLGKASGALNGVTNQAPGGLGGLLGAGTLGALLGGVLPKNMGKTVILAGAAATAWNFFQKWSKQQNQPQEPRHAELTSNTNWGESNWAVEQSQEKQLAPGNDDTVELVARAMVYAAKADGNIDPEEQTRMEAVLTNLIPGTKVKEYINAIKAEPLDPARLAQSVNSQEQAEDVYRLSCSVIDVDHFMETSYLNALANTLQISQNRQKELEQEAVAAKQALTRELGIAQ